MAFVDMESVQFYQPPTKAAAPPPKKIPSALNTSAPAFVTDSHLSRNSSEPVKIFDMSASPLGEFTDPFFPWTPELKCDIDVRDYSDELDRDVVANNQEKDFFALDDVVPEPGVSYEREETRKVAEDDYSRSIESAEQGPGCRGRLLTMEEPAKVQPIFAASLESLRKKLTYSIAPPSSVPSKISPDTSSSQSTPVSSVFPSNTAAIAKSPSGILPLNRNGPILSTKQSCIANNGNEGTGIEVACEGGAQGGRNQNSDSEDSNPPLLASSKQRTRSAIGEKHSKQRRRKRRRFTSPLRSDRDQSSYVPILTSKRQKAIAGIQSDPPLLCRTAVIYEQQSWEGEIVKERDVQQGRGRPRKQYLIQWNRSWVDGNRLNELHLLQKWRKRKMVEGVR